MERSSMLLRATSRASFESSADSSRGGRSWVIVNGCSGTELGGVKIGARLSLSRPGKRIPRDFKL